MKSPRKKSTTNHAIANRIGSDFVSLGRIRPLEEELAQIEAITIEDVQRVAQKYLIAKRRSVIRVIPDPEPELEQPDAADEAEEGA